MTRSERQQLTDIEIAANTLLDAPGETAAQITNLDVLEAVLSDVASVRNGAKPHALTDLIATARRIGAPLAEH